MVFAGYFGLRVGALAGSELGQPCLTPGDIPAQLPDAMGLVQPGGGLLDAKVKEVAPEFPGAGGELGRV